MLSFFPLVAFDLTPTKVPASPIDVTKVYRTHVRMQPLFLTRFSFFFNVKNQPSPGVSCIGLSATPNKWPVPSVERAVDQSVVEQMDDEDYDFVPGTPPSKKVPCLLCQLMDCLKTF